MKIATAIGAGLLTLGAMGNVAHSAAPPPLDRPSPPPCCADGVCHPNQMTYGWYQTRWRRWPLECLEPIPAANAAPTPSGQALPDLKPYETPSPEEEDRRAPPPSTPKAKAERTNEKAGEKAAEPAPAKSAEPGGTDVPLPMPWESKPEGGPTTDDPPPAPPYASAPRDTRPVAKPAVRSKNAPVRAATTAHPQISSTGDPPPALPLAVNSGNFQAGR